MDPELYLKFTSPEAKGNHSRLIVSRISNVNSIQLIKDKKGSYLKFNLADGSKPTCLCSLEDIGKLEKLMGPLARFDSPPGIFFNCKNITSFYFIKRGQSYQLNMSYQQGAPDCFDIGMFSPEQFTRMPCSEFFEE